ncbi:2,3,4,5-tetrahydropyridine-2,6-dicarboxylate N-succinyltransferase [Coxiella endosymbiont of Amblyomma americanum]|uniref:2,3,4,5-tetrahydropyridine-2,6-dicarboxylate N-succinyltransferase n=1 Tax=Coxiella endosymbiont of Amblyomma americanum TaxID=325775 RepID=UPI00057F934D|nr:2,3,4,5-tetrahydropyridine-2,6-dicarboxylate N-succinyltransferase [Coxiella endosymbiont of Amblyomma americanum]AJC50330.1 2,3,4,5-tetrahydropyridine-2,6-carboxylate N-succinyltransferase [Coxiella endosymbiont of Amblyomma americanum]AUJ58677.1 2,3,4,5-tetrahydropyridine-2,6-dicarboxylate N-succinyltransferase [Coxiella-like endosymbiont of Amblyomma americanum]
MHYLQNFIEKAYKNKNNFTSNNTPEKVRKAIHKTIELLDQGEIRVAEKKNGHWITNEWTKMAILLYFKTEPYKIFKANYASFYDKIPLKNNNHTEFKKMSTRIVPHAIVRKGAYLAKNTVLMPSYINIGAYINSGSLIDTWATIGSCAQIGRNVHISGGTGIGGVLEPLQTHPTIIEDNCFIGARSEITEGVIVEKGAVISMGVFIGQSTPIYNRFTKQIIYGRVPAGSVVISGSLLSKWGGYNQYSAIIIKQVDKRTQSKTSLNALLRESRHE